MTQGPDTRSCWNVETLCRWMFFVPKNVTRTIPLCTLLLLIKVVKWSSESSYLLVKIMKLCVKWFLFKYKNKMRHPPFPLQRTRYFYHHLKIASYPTRAVTVQKAATASNAPNFKPFKFKHVYPDLILLWHPLNHPIRNYLVPLLFKPSVPSIFPFSTSSSQTLLS